MPVILVPLKQQRGRSGRVKGELPRVPYRLALLISYRVYQLELLEYEDTGGLTPSGVVLALVGSENMTPSGKEAESSLTLRMYNLSSLVSLARWAITQKVLWYDRQP